MPAAAQRPLEGPSAPPPAPVLGSWAGAAATLERGEATGLELDTGLGLGDAAMGLGLGEAAAGLALGAVEAAVLGDAAADAAAAVTVIVPFMPG